MKTTFIVENFVILFLLSFSGCEILNEDKYVFPTFKKNQSVFTNDDLLNATYSDYKTPIDFYNEDLGDTIIYYTNTISIDSLDGKWIELSTNLVDIARNWAIRTTYPDTVFSLGILSDKFFEFVLLYNQKDRSIKKIRTHKNSYFNRLYYDFFNKSDTIGVYKKQNFSGDDAKELVDYLWYTHNYRDYSSKILSSYFEIDQQIINVYHFELFVVYGDIGVSDQISLSKMIYKIDKNSGIITIEEIKEREINGEMK
jgi:hypothetical protein